MKRSQSGFAYIAAVVFLVVIAGISVALLRLTDTQQSTVNQALLGARANLAARAGIEWVIHQPATRCDGSAVGAPNSVEPTGKNNHLADFRAQTGFAVSVRCTYRSYIEGEQLDADGALQRVEKRIYQVKSVACNGATDCLNPGNSVTGPDYVERARSASFCLRKDGAPCEG